MDYFPTSSSKRVQRQSTNKHIGKRLTQEQVNVLERNFMASEKKLDPERKLQLATELGVPPRQVAIWYQNKRARWKTQTLEIDYNALQVRLDATLSEKKVVERDLERLRSELSRTQEVLPLTSLAPTPSSNNFLPHPHPHPHPRPHPHPHPPPKDTVSGSCEEGGGSSNNSFSGDLDVNCGWEDENKALQLDDLYACMMFPNGSGRLD